MPRGQKRVSMKVIVNQQSATIVANGWIAVVAVLLIAAMCAFVAGL